MSLAPASTLRIVLGPARWVPAVCIDIAGQKVVVGVALVAVDGVTLPVVAANVRREVTTAVSRMTQLRVIQVDVLIADIDLEVLEEQS